MKRRDTRVTDNKYFYRHNQYGQVCNKYLTYNLLTIGFKQSAIDEFIFYQGHVIFAWYVEMEFLPVPVNKKLNNRSRTYKQ